MESMCPLQIVQCATTPKYCEKNDCIEINAINQSNLLVTCVVGLGVVCAVVAEFK